MFFQNSIKAVTAVALLLIACIVVGCGSGKPAPVVSPSDQDSVFKIVSTTFGSGIVDNSTSTDVGSYCSIAIDPDDNYPAVAYYDNYSSNRNLMYAKGTARTGTIRLPSIRPATLANTPALLDPIVSLRAE
jgi:hypothetical protein